MAGGIPHYCAPVAEPTRDHRELLGAYNALKRNAEAADAAAKAILDDPDRQRVIENHGAHTDCRHHRASAGFTRKNRAAEKSIVQSLEQRH